MTEHDIAKAVYERPRIEEYGTLRDITAQLDGDTALFRLADPGSPTLIQDREASPALYVLMPMRV